MATLAAHSFNPHIYAFLIRSRLQIRSYAAGATARPGSYQASLIPAQKSFQLALNELAAIEMPNDVGLLPGRHIGSKI